MSNFKQYLAQHRKSGPSDDLIVENDEYDLKSIDDELQFSRKAKSKRSKSVYGKKPQPGLTSFEEFICNEVKTGIDNPALHDLNQSHTKKPREARPYSRNATFSRSKSVSDVEREPLSHSSHSDKSNRNSLIRTSSSESGIKHNGIPSPDGKERKKDNGHHTRPRLQKCFSLFENDDHSSETYKNYCDDDLLMIEPVEFQRPRSPSGRHTSHKPCQPAESTGLGYQISLTEMDGPMSELNLSVENNQSEAEADEANEQVLWTDVKGTTFHFYFFIERDSSSGQGESKFEHNCKFLLTMISLRYEF